MKKTIFLFSILLLSSISYAQIEEINNLEEKSNQEIIATGQSLLKLIQYFSDFELDESRHFAPEEEDIIPAFELNSSQVVEENFNNALQTPIALVQDITLDQSTIKIDFSEYGQSKQFKQDYMQIKLKPETIYYYDQTQKKLENAKNFSLHFDNEMPQRKKIDSIRFQYSCSYITQIDTLNISLDNPTATYKGNKIHLEKMKNNLALYYTYNSETDIFLVEGLNQNGEVLDDYQYISGGGTPQQFKKKLTSLEKQLNTLIHSAQKDSTMQPKAFQEKYIAKLEKIAQQSNEEESDIYFHLTSFYGNVKSLRLYFISQKEKLVGYKTLHNKDNNRFFISSDNNNTYWINNDGKTIHQEKGNFFPINDYYYEDEKYYYHFNIEQNQFNKVIDYYAISKINNQYVATQTDEDMPYVILDKNRKQAFNTTFFDIEIDQNSTRAYSTNDDILLFSEQAEQAKWFKNLSLFSAFEHGYAVIKQNGLYGFVNEKGETIIPAQYEEVEELDHMYDRTAQDHLFAVAKNNLWGFVNENNQLVIPFQYQEVENFSYGIALVKNQKGEIALINTQNKAITTFEHSSMQSISANFGKITYSINNNRYNHLGKKID